MQGIDFRSVFGMQAPPPPDGGLPQDPGLPPDPNTGIPFDPTNPAIGGGVVPMGGGGGGLGAPIPGAPIPAPPGAPPGGAPNHNQNLQAFLQAIKGGGR